MKQNGIFLLFFLLSFFVKGENKLSPTLRAIQSEWSSTKTFSFEPQIMESVIVHYYTPTAITIIETKGGKVQTHVPQLKFATFLIPAGIIDSIAKLKEVRYLSQGIPEKISNNVSRLTTGVDSLHHGFSLSSPTTGKGVIIGMIDTGFEYNHINFYDSKGERLRVSRAWNQQADTGIPPEGFDYGAEYSGAKLVEVEGDGMYEIHATHTTGSAAGGDIESGYYGMAPDAEIIMVTSNFVDVRVIDAVKYITDYAAEQGKPCVINMSFGQGLGPHDGTGTLEQFLDEYQRQGVIFVMAAGNEGGYDVHTQKEFFKHDTLKTLISLERGKIYSWGELNTHHSTRFAIVERSTGKEIIGTNALWSNAGVDHYNERKDTLSIEQNEICAILTRTAEVSPTTGKPHTYVTFQTKNLLNDYLLSLQYIADKGTLHAWTLYDKQTNIALDGYTPWDNNHTISSSACGYKTIAVGAFVNRRTLININGGDIDINDNAVGDIAFFSSKGTTIDGRIKPDIIAPGTGVISSYNGRFKDIPSKYRYYVANHNAIGKDNYYGSISGTSMSAPIVSGIIATWMELVPTLDFEKAIEIIERTAIQDKYTGNKKKSPIWGFGKIDAWEGAKELLRTTSSEKINTSIDLFAARTIQAEKGVIELLFMQSLQNCNIQIYDVKGNLFHQEQMNYVTPGVEKRISLHPSAQGAYIIKVNALNNKHHSVKLVLR